MNRPSPAIVTASAARPLPRWALWLLCIAYAVPGFVGRDPWRYGDVASFGYMRALALGQTPWLAPQLNGQSPADGGLLPYWLGALALQWVPAELLAPEMAARLPFMTLLALTLLATWYGAYYLARSPGARPVAFAFGGEALPHDYARAMADSALLALIACLGLAQLSHEITGYLTQLTCTALVFCAAAAMPYRRTWAALWAVAGLTGLVLAGAAAWAGVWGLGSAALAYMSTTPEPEPDRDHNGTSDTSGTSGTPHWAALWWLGLVVGVAALAYSLNVWVWRATLPQPSWANASSFVRLWVWFGWPAWPLALWTLWRWRRQVMNLPLQRHLWLPLWGVLMTAFTTLMTEPADRALLLGLPALATLAAFALPTLQRRMAALIDWFTLLFFSISAIAIWVVWISLQTGIPAQPAANVARLARGFTPIFSSWAFAIALAASAAWCALVWWRAARHRSALWKSLVLPASGTTLAWLLLMTIWLPMLDYARSYAPQVRHIVATLESEHGCIYTLGLSDAQSAALQFHGDLVLRLYPQQHDQSRFEPDTACRWLAVASTRVTLPDGLQLPAHWLLHAAIGRPTGRQERLLLLRRID